MRIEAFQIPLGFSLRISQPQAEKNSNRRNNNDYFCLLEMRLSVLDLPPRLFCAFLGSRPKNIQIAKKNVHLNSKETFSSLLSVPRVLYNLFNVPQTEKNWKPLLYALPLIQSSNSTNLERQFLTKLHISTRFHNFAYCL